MWPESPSSSPSSSSPPPSSPFSPKRRKQLVLTLADRISPKKSYDRINGTDSTSSTSSMEEPVSLSGGERMSPVRTTPECIREINNEDLEVFRIDSYDSEDDEDDHDGNSTIAHSSRQEEQTTRLAPPSLLPFEAIPANFICPLTLQIMEDPVNDCCGHTFERRVIMERIHRSEHGDEEALCPISRKPLVPLCYSRKGQIGNTNLSNTPGGSGSAINNQGDSATTISCEDYYDRVLRRNEGLQRRIQEWKLENPLYQGADPHYAQRQRRDMIRRKSLTSDILPMHNSIHRSALDCPHGDDMEHSSSKDTSHHTLSRFERMFLPQEREFIKTLEERSREVHETRARSQRLRMGVSVVVALFLFTLLYFVAKQQRGKMATLVEGARSLENALSQLN